MDLQTAFESAFESANEPAFGDAWSREAVNITSAFEAAYNTVDLLLVSGWGDDAYEDTEARVAASIESLKRAVEGLVESWTAHKAVVLEYVLNYLLEAELRTVRKCAIKAADEASKVHWTTCVATLKTALKSSNRSVVLDCTLARAVPETERLDSNWLMGEWPLYTNVILVGAIEAIGQSAPETTYDELKIIRDICTVAHRAAILEVAFRAKRNACMAAPEATRVHDAVDEAIEVVKHEFMSS